MSYQSLCHYFIFQANEPRHSQNSFVLGTSCTWIIQSTCQHTWTCLERETSILKKTWTFLWNHPWFIVIHCGDLDTQNDKVRQIRQNQNIGTDNLDANKITLTGLTERTLTISLSGEITQPNLKVWAHANSEAARKPPVGHRRHHVAGRQEKNRKNRGRIFVGKESNSETKPFTKVQRGHHPSPKDFASNVLTGRL